MEPTSDSNVRLSNCISLLSTLFVFHSALITPPELGMKRLQPTCQTPSNSFRIKLNNPSYQFFKCELLTGRVHGRMALHDRFCCYCNKLRTKCARQRFITYTYFSKESVKQLRFAHHLITLTLYSKRSIPNHNPRRVYGTIHQSCNDFVQPVGR